jgi:hypothetical protein
VTDGLHDLPQGDFLGAWLEKRHSFRMPRQPGVKRNDPNRSLRQYADKSAKWILDAIWVLSGLILFIDTNTPGFKALR